MRPAWLKPSIRAPSYNKSSARARMVLSSSAYFIFLVAIFFLYWPVARFRALSLAVILFANYFFYAKWDLFYLALIPVASTCDFLIALGLQNFKAPALRRMLVTAQRRCSTWAFSPRSSTCRFSSRTMRASRAGPRRSGIGSSRWASPSTRFRRSPTPSTSTGATPRPRPAIWPTWPPFRFSPPPWPAPSRASRR